MKKIVIFMLSLVTMLGLVTVARADAIASPAGMAVALAYMYWPMVLVALLVIVTVLLLKKFKKK